MKGLPLSPLPSILFAGTRLHVYTLVARGTQERNTMNTTTGLERGPLDLESSAKTSSSPRSR